MTMLSADVFTNMAIAAMDSAFVEGPVVLKILTQQDVLIGTTSASGYSNSVVLTGVVTVNVTFTGILPFVVQSSGTPYKVEVWNNSETTCYFKIGFNSSPLFAGTTINITNFSHKFVSPYSVNPIMTYNSVFPVEFRVTYPTALLSNQYHYPQSHEIDLKHPTEVNIYGVAESIGVPRFWGAGTSATMSGYSQGFKVNFPNVRIASGGTDENHFNLSVVWEDSSTALWTITSTVPVPIDYSIKIDWVSKFHPTQLPGSVPAGALGPLDLTVERKLYGESSFSPVAVTQTSNVSSFTYYQYITANWEWKIAS